MLEELYAWIENLAFFMVILVAVIQLIPGENYKKYIRFYVGLILILFMLKPVFKIFHMDENYKELEEIKYMTQQLEERIGQ